MIKKPLVVAVKASWIIESPIIVKANAFRTVYTPNSTVLYFGLIDPEDMLIASDKDKKQESQNKSKRSVKIKTLARYCLDNDELINLKKEIDKTVEGLKKAGAIKDAT